MFSRRYSPSVIPKTELRQGKEGRGYYSLETGERIFKTFGQATLRQKKYLSGYLQGKTLAQAVIDAGYNVCSKASAAVIGCKLNLLFAKAIDNELIKRGWSPERVIDKLGNLSEEAHSESVQLGATQIIGKHLGMFPDRKIIGRETEDPAKKTTEELVKEAKELMDVVNQKNLAKTIDAVEQKFGLKKEEEEEKSGRTDGKPGTGEVQTLCNK